MITPEPLLRRDMIRWVSRVAEAGWVANHDGNATMRLPASRFLSTPTAMLKSEVREADLLILAADGRVLTGRHRPFSERVLHMAVYEARPDVGAVLHAHPPYATAFAVSGRTVNPCVIAEAVVSLGDHIPLVPYGMPGSQVLTDAVAAASQWYDALLLENHGVITMGRDLEQAYSRMELLEHLARIHHLAAPLGGARSVAEPDIERLLHARTKAGLGPAARGIDAPAPHSR